ncbi:MAG: phage holin family protein [bacterium]|nr:phage holin family protein [bacterium]
MFKIIISLFSNLVALLVAERFVAGFVVTNEPIAFVIVVALLAVANSIILPMLRLIFKPFIWLTFGVLALVLNGAMLYLVDFFSNSITISITNSWYPLIYATIIFGIINAIFALGARAFKR